MFWANMNTLDTYICRLCLKNCTQIETITETHQEVLNVLLLTLDLSVSVAPVMCKACAENLQSSFAFKTLVLYIKDQWAEVDLCLFCKQLVAPSSFVMLNDEQIDVLLLRTMLEQYYPELNLCLMSRPLMCTTCYEFLQKNFDFFIKCLTVEEQIKKYCSLVRRNSFDQINLKKVLSFVTEGSTQNQQNFCKNHNIKRENLSTELAVGGSTDYNSDTSNDKNKRYIKAEVNESTTSQNGVKVEGVWCEFAVECEAGSQIKEEDDVEQGYSQSLEQDYLKTMTEDVFKIEETLNEVSDLAGQIKMENCDKVVDTICECIEEVVRKFACNDEVSSIAGTKGINDGEVGIEKKDGETQTGGKRRRKKYADLEHDANNSVFQEAFLPKTILRTMITRTHVSGEEKYQCQVCFFVAKAKCSMNRHMRRHQDPSELTTYECHQCGFKTYNKTTLISHVVCHKNPSNAPVYQCEHCSFKAQTKGGLSIHMVRHKMIPKVTQKVTMEKHRILECYICGYTTCYKTSLVTHIRRHIMPKCPPKIYRCDKCFYQTNVEAKFENHVHKDTDKVVIYKCDFCPYKSRLKGTCNKHMKGHGEPRRCEVCDFKTKYTKTFHDHLRREHNIVLPKEKKSSLKQ